MEVVQYIAFGYIAGGVSLRGTVGFSAAEYRMSSKLGACYNDNDHKQRKARDRWVSNTLITDETVGTLSCLLLVYR